MELDQLCDFLKWCTLINGGILVVWAVIMAVMPGVVFRAHHQWFKVSREHFDAIVYSLIGFYKILFLIFNLVPYLALRIIAG